MDLLALSDGAAPLRRRSRQRASPALRVIAAAVGMEPIFGEKICSSFQCEAGLSSRAVQTQKTMQNGSLFLFD